jgi:hypothetical protein
MIEQPTKIGNKTLYNVRVLNISVAKHYGLVKEYCELVSKAREDLKTKRLHELAEMSADQIPVEDSDDNSESDIIDLGETSFEENRKIQDELTLYFSVKKHLDQLVLQKLMKNKIQKFGADKR